MCEAGTRPTRTRQRMPAVSFPGQCMACYVKSPVMAGSVVYSASIFHLVS